MPIYPGRCRSGRPNWKGTSAEWCFVCLRRSLSSDHKTFFGRVCKLKFYRRRRRKRVKDTYTYISFNTGSITALCVKHASGPPAAVKFENNSLAVLVLMLYAYISERYRSSLCPANMKSVLEVGSRTMECPKREGMMTCEPSACLRWDMMSA